MCKGSDSMESAVIVAIIGVFNVVFTTVFPVIRDRKRKKSTDTQIVEDGLQCLLRAEIIRSHDKYTSRRYCPIYAKENLKRAYDAYRALGGNDVATDLYHQCMALPVDPPDDDTQE